MNLGGHSCGEENRFRVPVAFSPEDRGLDAGGEVAQSPALDWFFELRHLRDLGFLYVARVECCRSGSSTTDPMGNPDPITPPRNGIGWFGQLSYLAPWFDLEIGARYGMNRALGDDSSFPETSELGGGVAYDFQQHALSLHLDVFHLYPADAIETGDQRVRLQLEAVF